jgi:hypothetical protein
MWNFTLFSHNLSLTLPDILSKILLLFNRERSNILQSGDLSKAACNNHANTNSVHAYIMTYGFVDCHCNSSI